MGPMRFVYQYIFDRTGSSSLARIAAATLIGALTGLVVVFKSDDLRLGSTWSILAVLGGGAMGLLGSLLLTLRDMWKAGHQPAAVGRRGLLFVVILILGISAALIVLITLWPVFRT